MLLDVGYPMISALGKWAVKVLVPMAIGWKVLLPWILCSQATLPCNGWLIWVGTEPHMCVVTCGGDPGHGHSAGRFCSGEFYIIMAGWLHFSAEAGFLHLSSSCLGVTKQVSEIGGAASSAGVHYRFLACPWFPVVSCVCLRAAPGVPPPAWRG